MELKKEMNQGTTAETVLLREFYKRKGEKLWFGKLITLFMSEDKLSVNKNRESYGKEISRGINFLIDFCLIEENYGETEKGYINMLYSITENGESYAEEFFGKSIKED